MTMLTRSEVAAILGRQDNLYILTHRRPDGDTVGSAAALCRGLRQLGKNAWVAENPEISEKYRPFVLGLTKPEPGEEDYILSVDTASPGMLAYAFERFAGQIRLTIDHHASSTPTAPQALIDSTAAATGEIICDLLVELGVKLDKALAEALYLAVSTDTGCFRYANTTAHTLAVAAECVAAGADIYPINQAMFETNSLAKLRLQGWMVENTRFFKEKTVALCSIPQRVIQELGATEDDTESITNFLRNIEGVCLAATLREVPQGGVKLSVRAVPGFDAGALCARFGGGGHKGAAGATLYCPPEEAARRVAEAMLADA